MNNLSFNGSKVDRQFSYSKIDFALRQNNRTEQQHLQPTPSILPSNSHSAIEQVGSITGGLFDLPIAPQGNDYEEDEFRRRMHKKPKKKGIRR